ncbi:MAG TPA: DEAD/DEAH box helicase, partial [Candidatus Hydrogenedentes bacterium]|nr:DEAD/DEAH box helicase [Candidatus Hydrogenedentota bacterium]
MSVWTAMGFDDLGIAPSLLSVLETLGIETPTPVQREAIPVALAHRDLVAVAQTGTGKTLAYALPALMRLSDGPVGRNLMLVLTPTRELAQQVHGVFDVLGRPLGIRSTAIYGGVGYEAQATALKRGVSIVVATPGRLLDHMRQGRAHFGDLMILVLDEADRMLDMGFLPDIRSIIQ